MKQYSKWVMWTHLVVPLCAVLLSGFVAISTMMVLTYRRQSREEFMASVQEQAAFMRNMSLPMTSRMAENLSAVLGRGVYFVSSESGLIPNPQKGSGVLKNRLLTLEMNRVHLLREGAYEAVRCAVDGGWTMVVIREKPEYLNRATLGNIGLISGVFLATVLAVGWLLTRRLVRPLKQLAGLIARFDGNEELERPRYAGRRDEIGLVARALLDTRTRFLQERSRRRNAERKAALLRITGSLAHEIRNPIAAVQMHLQLLDTASEKEQPAAVNKALPVIRRELCRIEKMLNQWMYLVNPRPSARSICNLGELIHASIVSHTPLAEHAGVDMIFHEGRDITVAVDEMRISMTLDNLLRNGIQAMPDGGGLHIDCEHIGNEVRVRISDEGRGFSPEALERAMDLFYSEKEGGMGVGLSVCRAIIEAHGGCIDLGNCMVMDDGHDKVTGGRVEFRLPSADLEEMDDV